MKISLKAVYVVFLLFFSLQAQSNSLNSENNQKLSRVCGADVGEIHSKGLGYYTGFCFGIIEGVIKTAGITKGLHNIDYFCPPERVSTGQMAAIFGNFLKANPQDWHRDSGFLALLSFKRAYPCNNPASN